MTKTLKYIVITVIIILAIFASIGGKIVYDIKQAELIQEKIYKNMGEYGYLNLTDLVNFKWDKAYIFPPYALAEDVNKRIGYKWAHDYWFVDDYYTLAFMHKEKVVYSVTIIANIDSEFIYKQLSPGDIVRQSELIIEE